MESNSKPLYQPWNEEEFQADVFVRGMTWLQRHLYRSLLQAMFFHTTRPYLPNDDDVLWVLAGAETPEMWEENKTKILKRFTVCSESPHLLENKRVTADWDRLTDARSKMAELGQRSAVVRKALHGSAQPTRPVLTSTERTFDERSNDSRTYVRRSCNDARTTPEQGIDIVSEEKKSEEKISNSPAMDVSSSARQPMADWKNIALRHRTVFGKKAGVNFKDKYFEACKNYGEDVVLQCFDDWAAGAKDWIEANNVKEPLFPFFKKLPAEAADAVELNAAEVEQRNAAKQEADSKEEKFQALLTEQIAENQKQWEVKPLQNTESVEDFLK